MNTNPEILTTPDLCDRALSMLLSVWPEESDELSPTLLDHLGQCRSCLQKWIALETAADLARLPLFCDEAHSGDDAIPPDLPFEPRV